MWPVALHKSGKYYRVAPDIVLRDLMHNAPAIYARAKENWDNQLWQYYSEKPAPPLVLRDYKMIVCPAILIGDRETKVDPGVSLIHACKALSATLTEEHISSAYIPPLGHIGRGGIALGICVAILSYYLDDRFTLVHLTEENRRDYCLSPR